MNRHHGIVILQARCKRDTNSVQDAIEKIMMANTWATAPEAWKTFTHQHPELGYRDGRQQFHNFLRRHRDALVHHDAIRRAKGKYWIAHQERFCEVAFELATRGRL